MKKKIKYNKNVYKNTEKKAYFFKYIFKRQYI